MFSYKQRLLQFQHYLHLFVAVVLGKIMLYLECCEFGMNYLILLFVFIAFKRRLNEYDLSKYLR